jgi:hypothetical protein
MRTIYHVLPYKNLWAVKINKGRRASSVHKNQAQALRAASNLAKSHPKSQVVIHKATGTIKGGRKFEYRHYKKKQKIRTVVGKIKKTKIKNLQKEYRLRSLRRKAAKLGLARKKREHYRRSQAAKMAARKRVGKNAR